MKRHGFSRLIRRVLGMPAPRPRLTPAYTEAELLARAEEFNRNAEAYWQEVDAQTSGRRQLLSKPFSTVRDSPGILYRLGLVLTELHLGVGHAVLDFGAGSCWLSACLNRMGCRTVSIDVSPTALKLGRELMAKDAFHRPELNPQFLPYDGHRISLPNESVDRAVLFDAFHHVPNQDEVLSELFRVLRWGGRAVLAEPGEGHSHEEQSRFEAERCGVLENDLEIPVVEEKARRIGFTEVLMKPHPEPGSFTLPARDYVRLMEGAEQLFPLATLREQMRQFFIFILAKGPEVVDSRNPNLLRAEIRPAGPDTILRGRGAATVTLPLTVKNVGDTVWLHQMNETGGYVMLGGHLYDERGRPVSRGFFRVPLPHSVAPGESVGVLAEIPFPADMGRYRVKLDLVDEYVAWFEQTGSTPTNMELEVTAYADGTAAGGLRANIELVTPAPAPAKPGTALSLAIRATNVGLATWTGADPPAPGTVTLAAVLADARGNELRRDLRRVPVGHDVAPGESVALTFRLNVPTTPGDYRLKLDLVEEHVCWFEQRGSTPLHVAITVTDETPDSRDPGELRAGIELRDRRTVCEGKAGTNLSIPLRLTNLGNTRWLHEPQPGGGQVALGGHLYDAARRPVAFDFLRTPLPRDVDPGESVDLVCEFAVPESAGRYHLELDMVDEQIAWFGPAGSPTAEVEVHALP